MDSTRTLTLTDFLLARIAEDEDTSRSNLRMDSAHRTVASEIAAEYATKTLAECKAKRRIVERCRASNGYWGAEVERMLALPYTDHPDYREEWAV